MTPGVYCTSIHSIPMHVIISSPHIHHLYRGIPLILHISEIINSQSLPSCLKKIASSATVKGPFHPFYCITTLFSLLYTYTYSLISFFNSITAITSLHG